MNQFKLIETACEDAMTKYGYQSSLAFQCGYYKSQTERLCAEVEFLKQELESTIEQIKDVMKDLA
jgi:aerobic-type carbon monoxide dehydrogenase small subunit (CoxS/CutS family)